MIINPNQSNLIEKPLLIDTNRLKPVTQDLRGIECSHCNQPRTMWAFLPVEHDEKPELEPVPLCSRCFLYESGWGSSRTSELNSLLLAAEEHMKKTFEKNEDGRLKNDKDCDTIIAYIAMASILYQREAEKKLREELEASRSAIIQPSKDQFIVKV
jgi:hypothetical protein